MGTKKVETTIYLSPDIHLALLAQKDRTGQSLSSIVESAVQKYFLYEEMQSGIKRAHETLREVKAIMKRIEILKERNEEALKVLASHLEELTLATKVMAFFASVNVELFKMRHFQTKSLTDKEFDEFKELWFKAHKIADARVKKLLGEEIWRKAFDPGELPKLSK